MSTSHIFLVLCKSFEMLVVFRSLRNEKSEKVSIYILRLTTHKSALWTRTKSNKLFISSLFIFIFIFYAKKKFCPTEVFLNKAERKRGWEGCGCILFNKKIWYFDWRSQKDWSEGELTDKSLFKKTPFYFFW